ncbi:hypothetical protein RN001_008286 [Aquatica leii]|uniref:RecA family profile 1 domain-containing protein n=1 Tax=Aquatica leii TaxID=1421715 RepID=A0AAN7SRA7_9COLE|nr:hypothetical protein RN001_008286 [Aquatica leii]
MAYMDALRQYISSDAYDRLLKANLSYVDIIRNGEIYLSQVTELTLNDSKQLISEALKLCFKTTFQPTINVPEWRRLTTCCDSIDRITRGGIPVNRLVEVAGASGVGKTQFCLQLALTVQLPVTAGGLSKGAVYICTEDIFPSKRFLQLSNAFGSKYPHFDVTFMDNVFLEHISDYEQLRRCCTVRLPKLLQQKKIGLIVIDSIAGIFRSENVNVNYATRSQQFYTITSTLVKLSMDYGIAIVNTNQVIDNTETGKMEPCLGLAWSNLVTCRFWLCRFSGNIRSFEVVFAPDLPNSDCKFAITEAGLIGANV